MTDLDNLPEFDAEPVDWANVEATLAEAKRWLNAKQPKGAILTHLGLSNYVGHNTSISAAPSSWHGGPADGGTIVIERQVRHYVHGPANEDGVYPPPHAVAVAAPFTPAECDRFDTMIRSHFEVLDRWNVNVATTGSWGIRVRKDGAATAVAKYHEGCPVPGHHVFCGGWQASNDEQRACRWRDGFDLLKPPRWIATARAEPGMPEPAEPVRNAEVVAATIDETSKILAEIGVHPQTVRAGALGTIEGEPGEREFVQADAMALGVALPAEAFRELVRLAALGAELEATGP